MLILTITIRKVLIVSFKTNIQYIEQLAISETVTTLLFVIIQLKRGEIRNQQTTVITNGEPTHIS